MNINLQGGAQHTHTHTGYRKKEGKKCKKWNEFEK